MSSRKDRREANRSMRENMLLIENESASDVDIVDNRLVDFSVEGESTSERQSSPEHTGQIASEFAVRPGYIIPDHSDTSSIQDLSEGNSSIDLSEEIVNTMPEFCEGATVEHTASNREMNNLANKLRCWAIEESIAHVSLKKLLNILRDENVGDLPRDPRTLLRTPTNISVEVMGAGQFYYFGIENSINYLCAKHSIFLRRDSDIQLAFNIDGLPITANPPSSFWPILGLVKSISELQSLVFVIALYRGADKPKDPNTFLQKFVDEATLLTNNGIQITGRICKFQLYMMICDAPAKSYILCVKGHSGYYSCTKCEEEGDIFDGRVSFPVVDGQKRTNERFKNKTQPEHHIGSTILVNIPRFDIVDDIPLDYMHLVCIGVVKRLLAHKQFGLVHGKPPFKLRAAKILQISSRLLALKKYIPVEFSRKTRSLVDCKSYKATELRCFLLYTGVIVLKTIIASKFYNNFLCLSVAITIMLSNTYVKDRDMVDYAHNLLIFFVKNSVKLYGPAFASHNVHNLCHLRDCVRRFDSLHNFSAFPFENHMRVLKKRLRKPDKQLQQVVLRTLEENLVVKESRPQATRKKTPIGEATYMREHSDGPVTQLCNGPQYKKAVFPHFTLTTDLADRFVELSNGEVLEIQNFSYHDNEPLVIGLRYIKSGNFFNRPCPSSYLGIHTIEKQGNELKCHPLSSICKKLLAGPFGETLVAFPLVHL